MKPKTLILMVVAVVCGLGASYMTSRLLAEREERPAAAEPPPVERVKVLVAKKNLDMHTAFKKKPEDYFVEKTFVKEDAPKDALTKDDLSKLKEKYLKRSLRKNDYITQDDVIDNPQGLRTLPPGMRAVGIPVTPQSVASGFACVPGSHVDIVYSKRGRTDKESLTKTLLENVIVLAADINAQPGGEGGAMPANVVTVALTPEDANVLIQAMASGQVNLVLRNMDDAATSDTPFIVTESDLAAARKKLGEPKTAQADGPPIIEGPLPKADHNPPQKDGTPNRGKQLTKVTATVRNGADVQLHHYWVDEQGRIVANPQQYLDQYEQDDLPAPTPAPVPPKKDGGKKGDI